MSELEYTIYSILLEFCDSHPYRLWGSSERLIHDKVIKELDKARIHYNPVTVYDTINDCINKLLEDKNAR